MMQCSPCGYFRYAHIFLSLPNVFKHTSRLLLAWDLRRQVKFPNLSVSLLLIVVAVSDIRLPIVEVIRGNLLERDDDKRGKGG